MSDGQSAAAAASASQAQRHQAQTNTYAGVASGAQAVGGIVGAWAEYRAGKFNAKVARLNAEVDRLRARDAIRRGKIAQDRQRQAGRQLISRQRAAFAGQGVSVDQDVAGAVVADTERMLAQDVETIGLNAELEAWGHRVSAVDNRSRAAIAEREGVDRAAGTLLTTSARSVDTYRSLTR